MSLTPKRARRPPADVFPMPRVSAPSARGRRRGDVVFYCWLIAHIAVAFLLVASVGAMDGPRRILLPEDRRIDRESSSDARSTRRVTYTRRSLASVDTPTPSPSPANASSETPAPDSSEAGLVNASDGATARARETTSPTTVGGDSPPGVKNDDDDTGDPPYAVDTDGAGSGGDGESKMGYGPSEYIPFALGIAAVAFIVLMCFDTLVALTLLLCLGAVVAASVVLLTNSEDDTRWRDDEFNGHQSMY